MRINLNRKHVVAYLIVKMLVIVVLVGGCVSKKTDDSTSVFQQIGGVDQADNVVTYTQPSQNLDQAIKYFAAKEYDKAIASFQKVLVTNPNQQEMGTAYSGIGWCKVKKSGVITDGMNDFQSGYAAKANLHDPKVGLAAAYLLQDTAKIREAITLLESIGRGETGDVTLVNPSFRYVSEIGTGVSNASVHSLLASLYYYNNQDELSKQQLDIAKQEAPENERLKSIDTAIMTLGY